jgi:hypothetical protein
MKKPRKTKRAPKPKKKLTLTGEPSAMSDPRLCPICGALFKLVVGCHKICECGYMEGCGD